MQNYLDLIKNPKRGSRDALSTSPPNRPRDSSPISNQARQSNKTPSYINNIGKIQAVNLERWGSNPSDKSNPPQNQTSAFPSNLPQEPSHSSPKNTRRPEGRPFSSNIPSFGNPSFVGGKPTNLYGDFPGMPSFAKREEPVISNNTVNMALRNPPVITVKQDNPKRYTSDQFMGSKGNNLFGDVNIGETRNRLQPLNNNIGNVGLNKMGGSGQSRQSQNTSSSREEKLSRNNQRNQDPRSRSRSPIPTKKPTSKKNKGSLFDLHLILFVGLIVILVGVVAAVVLTREKQPLFCDTGDEPRKGECIRCPENGICENGKLVGCDQPRLKVYNNKCVEDPEIDPTFSKYRQVISDYLAYLKGERLCYPEVQTTLSLREIHNELSKRYPKERNLGSPANFPYFEEHWDHYYREDEGLLKEIRNYHQVHYLTNQNPNPSFKCKMLLLWREGRIFALWIVLFASIVILSGKIIHDYIAYSRMGAEVYQEIKSHLAYWKSSRVKSLQSEFSHKFPTKDFEKIWKYVENYRRKEAKIYQYFDNSYGVFEEFWLLN